MTGAPPVIREATEADVPRLVELAAELGYRVEAGVVRERLPAGACAGRAVAVFEAVDGVDEQGNPRTRAHAHAFPGAPCKNYAVHDEAYREFWRLWITHNPPEFPVDVVSIEGVCR